MEKSFVCEGHSIVQEILGTQRGRRDSGRWRSMRRKRSWRKRKKMEMGTGGGGRKEEEDRLQWRRKGSRNIMVFKGTFHSVSRSQKSWFKLMR